MNDPRIEVRSIRATPLDRKHVLVAWEFAPTLERFSDYEIWLEKSNAPHDGFERVTALTDKTGSYIDEERVFKFWKQYFVRINIKSKNDDYEFISDAYGIEYPPNVEAMELIRRTKVTLENNRYGNGIECNVFLKKTGGQRCVECFDHLKGRVTKSQCDNCYGTGYTGGFYIPIKAYINFSVDRKVSQIADVGRMGRSENHAIMGGYPVLRPGDVIHDARLHRVWVIVTVENIERRRHLIKQKIHLDEQERTHVLYLMCEEKNAEQE